MDPETLRTTVQSLIGRELTLAETSAICDAAARMLNGAAPILDLHPGGVPAVDFADMLRELAGPGASV